MTLVDHAPGDAVNRPVFPRPSTRRHELAAARTAWASWAGWGAVIAVLVGYLLAAVAGITSWLGVAAAVGLTIALTPLVELVGRRVPGMELAGLFRLSLALKLLATLPRYLTRADSRDYYRVGRILADEFRSLNFVVDPGRAVPGTGTIRYLTGLVEVVTVGDEFATFLVFSMFGFVATILFVEAFHTAMPSVDPRRYTLLVLFWPSLIYWPSSIGKDAVMLLGLSLIAMGVARLLHHRVGGIIWVVPGLLIAGLVRPHVALIAATAAVCAMVVKSRSKSVGGMVLRVGVIISLILGGAVASNAVESSLNIDGLNPTGLTAALDLVNRRSTQGGSGFVAARIDTPLDFPRGFVTVMFRPFPYEAGSIAMLITAVEAMVLAALVVAAIPRIFSAMRNIRADAYLVYAIAFMIVFAYLFSAMGNFGILARQRTMVLPLVLVLVGLPTPKDRVRRRRLDAGS